MIGKAIIPRTEGMKEYIDYYYNKRIKGKLKGMNPVQYRVHSQAT